MAISIDLDHLISLVEERPVIWDKTLEIYKERKLTKTAWNEIFHDLNDDYFKLEDAKKEAYGKEVMKRWGNIRDSFQKSLKKCKPGTSIPRTYIYGSQLQFLKKATPQEDSTEDSPSAEHQEEDEPTVIETPGKKDIISNNNNGASLRKRKASEGKPDLLELELLQILKEKPDRHTSFFRGLIPTLNKFDDDEVVEFQLTVLQKISDIKKSRKQSTQQNTRTSRNSLH